ncbi:unnamed protein product [Mesocestoides corti]|uniref:30S ribosomal protein S8e n=1 Tax=Mesocestoides corti TaxID=53468 RepID=A0A0R3UMN8_MESCO|nr:unnamed protein product [Mesocestoides corti]
MSGAVSVGHLTGRVVLIIEKETKVWLGEPLSAEKTKEGIVDRFSERGGGTTDVSAPESIKNRIPVDLSGRKRRRFKCPLEVDAITAGHSRFLTVRESLKHRTYTRAYTVGLRGRKLQDANANLGTTSVKGIFGENVRGSV